MAVQSDTQAMQAHLQSLGVREDLLSAAARDELDREGVLILENHMSPDVLRGLRDRFDQLIETEKAAGKAQGEVGSETAHNLVDKGEIFAATFTDPTLLAAACHVIGRPFKLMALNGRSALPGHGLQGLHPDWLEPVEPGTYHIINSMWLLDDLIPENGSTRFVPRSHRSGRMPTDDLENVMEPHPDEQKLVAPAGSMAIINAHVWHGGSLNTTDRPRRVLHCAFVAREFPQQTVQKDNLSPATVERLSPAERWLLDV